MQQLIELNEEETKLIDEAV